MRNIVELYSPENIWPYIINPKDNRFEGNDIEKKYFKAVKKFGELCAVNVMSFAVSNPKDRPLFPEYIDTFNQLTKEFLKCIEENKNITLSEIGKNLEAKGFSSYTVDGICYGDTSNIATSFGPNTLIPIEEYLDFENRKNIISEYARCLFCLKKKGIDLPIEYSNNRKRR